jgi:hypothetical protein
VFLRRGQHIAHGGASVANVRIIAGIVVGRAADAAWIEGHWAVGQLDEMPLVAVSAQNYAGLHSTQSLLDRSQTRSNKWAVRHLLDEIPIVAGRRTVAGENVMLCVGGSR